MGPKLCAGVAVVQVVALVPRQHVLPALAQARGDAAGSSGPGWPGQRRGGGGGGAVLAPAGEGTAGDAALCEGSRQRGWKANGAQSSTQAGILVMSGKAVMSTP